MIINKLFNKNTKKKPETRKLSMSEQFYVDWKELNLKIKVDKKTESKVVREHLEFTEKNNAIQKATDAMPAISWNMEKIYYVHRFTDSVQRLLELLYAIVSCLYDLGITYTDETFPRLRTDKNNLTYENLVPYIELLNNDLKKAIKDRNLDEYDLHVSASAMYDHYFDIIKFYWDFYPNPVTRQEQLEIEHTYGKLDYIYRFVPQWLYMVLVLHCSDFVVNNIIETIRLHAGCDSANYVFFGDAQLNIKFVPNFMHLVAREDHKNTIFYKGFFVIEDNCHFPVVDAKQDEEYRALLGDIKTEEQFCDMLQNDVFRVCMSGARRYAAQKKAEAQQKKEAEEAKTE